MGSHCCLMMARTKLLLFTAAIWPSLRLQASATVARDALSDRYTSNTGSAVRALCYTKLWLGGVTVVDSAGFVLSFSF